MIFGRKTTSGDSQFQEFFVKLQHLVLSFLANNQNLECTRVMMQGPPFFRFIMDGKKLKTYRCDFCCFNAENLTTLGSEGP